MRLFLLTLAILLLAASPISATPSVSSIQISIRATGSGTLTYQWYKSGVLLAGQTSSIISVPSADVSLYSVIVKDADGSTQTANLNITVMPPVIVIPPPPPPPPGTVGPRGPVGPSASVQCNGTSIPAGASIQAAVNAAPINTTFCLAAGTYTRQQVAAKNGDKFIGKIGTILDGQSATTRAFTRNATNVTVQNIVVQNYIGGYQVPAIDAGSGWQVLNNEIKNNDGVGVSAASNGLYQYNFVHHNLEMGFGTNATGATLSLLDNEISFNNYTNKYDCGNECGGGKFWATVGAVFSYNYTHDNHGPGIWDDYNNNNITYSFNRIENNLLSGIMHEISYNSSIHDNVISGNGSAQQTNMNPPCVWLWCNGILISASGGVSPGFVEIYNNTITTGSKFGNAIGMVQQNRTVSGGLSPSMGPYLIHNVWVHDNTIDLSKGGAIGGVTDTGTTTMFQAAANNRFDLNHYILGTNISSPFWWGGGTGGKAFWQGKGMDLNGTFQ